MYGDKVAEFAYEFGKDTWVVDLYYEFVRFLGGIRKRYTPLMSGKSTLLPNSMRCGVGSRSTNKHNQCSHGDAHYIAPLAPFRGRVSCKRHADKEIYFRC